MRPFVSKAKEQQEYIMRKKAISDAIILAKKQKELENSFIQIV
jgi:hypothetical protein